MPEVRVLGIFRVPVAVAVGRNPEANLGAGEHVGRFCPVRRIESCPSTGNVGVVGPDDGV